MKKIQKQKKTLSKKTRKMLQRLTQQLQYEYSKIEKRENLNDDEKVSQIIKITSALCGGLAFQPIPFADIFLLTPIQIYMASRIACIRGYPVTENNVKDLFKKIIGVVGLGYSAQQFAIALYKIGLPGIGGFMTIPLVYSLTYSIGKVIDFYFVHKSKKLDPQEVKKIWKQAKKDSKNLKKNSGETIKKFKKIIKNIKEKLHSKEPIVDTFKKDHDEMIIIITSSLKRIRGGFRLTETDQAILTAFARYSNKTQDLESIKNYLKDFSDKQIEGVASNLKGILHEMEFVSLENNDGDLVTGALFPEINHKGFDVILHDSSTGEKWEVQLKATDSTSGIHSWLEKYPDGEILVSEEISSKLNLPSSGILNKELTVKVEDFINKILSDSNISVQLLQSLPLISIAIVIKELHKRYKSGAIHYQEFKKQCLLITAHKTIKFTVLFIALNIPGLNVIVGTSLIFKILKPYIIAPIKSY